MSNVIGFLLAIGFGCVAIRAYQTGEPFAAAIFLVGLIATVLELLREPRR